MEVEAIHAVAKAMNKTMDTRRSTGETTHDTSATEEDVIVEPAAAVEPGMLTALTSKTQS